MGSDEDRNLLVGVNMTHCKDATYTYEKAMAIIATTSVTEDSSSESPASTIGEGATTHTASLPLDGCCQC